MKKSISYLFLAVPSAFLISCGNSDSEKIVPSPAPSYQKIKNLDWLTGTWNNFSADGSSHEIWTKINDSTYKGSGVFIVGKDTVSREDLSLEERNHELLYVPTVNNQNNNEPVTFTLTSFENNTWIFENPLHDFPKKITYKRITEDSLVAEISGVNEGRNESLSFPMKREK